MKQTLFFLAGMALMAGLVHKFGNKQDDIRVEVERWKHKDNLVNTVKIYTETRKDLWRLSSRLREWHPYVYKSRLEVIITTKNEKEFIEQLDDLLIEIKQYGDLIYE